MTYCASQQHMNEQELVKLYMQLTGTAESEARNVFMYVCRSEQDAVRTTHHTASMSPGLDEEPTEVIPSTQSTRFSVSVFVIACLALMVWPGLAGERSETATPPPSSERLAA